jgi:hypothetical protein
MDVGSELERIIKSCDIFYCSMMHHDGGNFVVEMEYEVIQITGEGPTLAEAIIDLKKSIPSVIEKHVKLDVAVKQLLVALTKE